MLQSQQEHIPVTVDTRALIDKVLARYSGEFTVFRELLQNSDDAECDAAEIRFETAAFLGLNREVVANEAPPIPPDLRTTNVTQWTFRNHGKPFTPQDWDRLPRIALGNPDPLKVGAFGVGFYTLFSMTERPYVASGGKAMQFSWDDQDQLLYSFGNLPRTTTTDLWTTFKMPLREANPMPTISELLQFLASSITFMIHLKDVTIFFDDHCVGKVNKTLGQSQAIPISPDLERSSPEKHMIINSIQQSSITIKAEASLPGCDSMRIPETKVDLTLFTAGVEVVVDQKLSRELKRCTKKDPRTELTYSLIYTGKDEYDQSCISEVKHTDEFPSPFQGLRADLDGAWHTRIFVGHATAQTTGVGGHMASHFIPTVERESIDLVDRNVAIWNRELLYVGGFLCRTVYDLELSEIQDLWSESLSRKLQDRLHERFLHVLKFFTFHHSTPSSKVAELLADAFYQCSTLPLRFLSSVGVLEAPRVRAFNPVFTKFLKSLPMLSKFVAQDCARFIAALPDQHKIPTTTFPDVLQALRCHTLDVEELVECLRWWITSGKDNQTSSMADLFDAASVRITGGVMRLSSITHFVDPDVLGLHIPPDGPLPLSLLPTGISKHFRHEQLTGFGWVEFTVASWLQYLLRPDVMSANEKYAFTASVDGASLVLSTLSRLWRRLPEDIRQESAKAFRNKPCIPTRSHGLCCPECSYFPITTNALFHHIDLPMVSCNPVFEVDEDMKRLLLFIGVRKNPPIRLLLHQMPSAGCWTVSNLLDYLVREPQLTSEDICALKSSKIFTKECLQDEKKESTHYCADELYPPVEIFRSLQLPVIEWNEGIEWGDASPRTQLLYRIGLNHFPPLPKIMDLCRGPEVQEKAFMYLFRNLHSQYLDYNPEKFRDLEFIPAVSKDRTCLRKLGEVYSGAQWKALGFFVVQDRYLNMQLDQLGITQHPPTPKILDLLKNTPPPDKETARQWFEVLFDHMAIFSPLDLNELSMLPIVPTGPANAPKFLSPTECYLEQGVKQSLYEKLFAFVDFGTKANRFLSACGSKNKVPVENIAVALIEGPRRFFDLAGGYEGFLVELRKLAYHSQNISNNTLHKMSHGATLLGVCRTKPEGQVRWDYEYQFLTHQEIVIVDDMDDYQLFGDCVFVAPQEEVLERFYALLGCGYLSMVVKEGYNDLHEIPATKASTELQSLIIERLPWFIQRYTDITPKVTIPSSSDRLKVKACKGILVCKVLVKKNGNVKRTRAVWAIARREGDCIELWISESRKRDMYEVAISLCRLLFGTNKLNVMLVLLLDRLLSADLKALERSGYLVDQISQQSEHSLENVAREKHTESSISTTNSPRQCTVDTQPNLRLNESLVGSPEPNAQLRSRAADSGVSLKIRETSNVPDNENSVQASLPLSRISCEVIPQSCIRDNVEKAIEACGKLRGEELAIRAGVSQFLSSGFCMMSADAEGFHHIGQVRNIQVWVAEGMHGADTFMERMQAPLARFVGIVLSLSMIYNISPTTLRVFYDVSRGCIAFNCRGIIYLNLRYFEVWHDEQVKRGNQQNAQMSWFLALAHEIAHNVTDQHNSDHEFWFSAICEARLVAFSRLLQPTNTRFRYALCFGFLVATLLACLVQHIAPVTNLLARSSC